MKNKYFYIIVSLVVGLIVLMVAGCGGQGGPGAGSTGKIEVRATDAPPEGVSRIMVTAENIQVHRSGASENSWITVVKEENTFDLVALQGVEILLGTSELEAGQYTQIRLDVTKVMVTMGNEEIEAKLPGEKLKVVRPWEIKAGETTVLTLDFEADKFVVMTGKGSAQVKPVIKLEVSQGDRPLKTKETKENAGTPGGQKPEETPSASPTLPPTGVGSPGAKPAAAGKIEVRATDAPPEGVSRIMVTAENIQVHRSGASENSWITVVKEENTFDLVALQGVEILLGTSELEAGQYTQIRLDVTKVMVTMGNEEIEAKLPGEKLKVVRPWEIKAGETTVLTLDFEADKFVVMTGKGNAQVKPVIKLEVSRGKRPLKTKETKEKPDDKPAPKASPTVATGAETTQQGSPPGIPHTLQGRDNCLLCHGSTGIEPFPSDHAGRTIEICQGCHKAAGQ